MGLDVERNEQSKRIKQLSSFLLQLSKQQRLESVAKTSFLRA
jgi:hypothetical protein